MYTNGKDDVDECMEMVNELFPRSDQEAHVFSSWLVSRCYDLGTWSSKASETSIEAKTLPEVLLCRRSWTESHVGGKGRRMSI